MIRQLVKYGVKLLVFTPQQRLAITAGELAAKGVKKAYNASQEAKRQKELQERIATISNRGFFKTLLIYILGFIFSFFIMKWGWIGILLVLLGYIGHYANLKELQSYINVAREKVLTWIFIFGLAGSLFLF